MIEKRIAEKIIKRKREEKREETERRHVLRKVRYKEIEEVKGGERERKKEKK